LVGDEKVNILFLSIGKMNSIEERGLYTDLIREFRDNGHQMYVVSSREKRVNKSTEFINENGVNFLRVKIGNITKVNNIEKGISTLRIENLFLQAIKKNLQDTKFDLVMYSTPPITFGKVISYIKKRDNAKSYLLLKDIFPQNAVDLNMLSKKGFIYKYFRSKEKRLYKQSDYIGCMSNANADFILNHNPILDSQTIEICPNSIDPVKIDSDDLEVKRIREKYNIPFDKTVFIYGGNLGKPQGIGFLIECLEANKENNMAYFIIVGSGTEFNKIQTYFNTNKPSNAQLFKQLPKEDYEALANSCDVGLVFLDHRFTIPNFPSRLLSYMQASMPILAATDSNTDIGLVVENGKFGYWCESNNVQAFNQKLEFFYDKPVRDKMGQNARKYLEENYTTKHSYEVIMSHFK